MKVYANLNTFEKVLAFFDRVGMMGMFRPENLNNLNMVNVAKELLVQKKLVELLQIITRDDVTDFNEMEFEEMGGILNDFFQGITKLLPGQALSYLKGTIQKEINLQMAKTFSQTTTIPSND